MARNPSHLAPSLREVRRAPFAPPEPPALGEAEAALRADVMADADADAPRLAYADFNGGERGRFIRTQIEIAERDEPSPESLDVEDELLVRHGKEWQAELTPWSAKDVVFRRGFAESLSLSGRAFISLGDGLFRTAPIRDVRLVAVQPYVRELAACPHLARLRRLDLTGNRIDSGGLRELLRSPHARFESLDLSANGIALADLESPGRYRELGLKSNQLHELPLNSFENLESLAVSHNPLGPDTLRRLAASPFAKRLRVLEASHCGFGPDADWPFEHLVHLDLGFNDLASTKALFERRRWPHLKSLRLRGNRLHAADVLHACPRLESLDLASNPLGDAGIRSLLDAPPHARLRHLDLANIDMSDAGLEHLASSPLLAGLRSLSLAWNRCGDRAASALARSPQVRNLRTLDLTGWHLGYRGAIALAGSPHFASLRSLVLGHNTELPADVLAMLKERFS